MSSNQEADLQQQIVVAREDKQPLYIVGQGSKSFYGREIVGRPLSMKTHCGVVDYEPTELVVTVRAGMRITELVQILAEENQMLGFEPPDFDGDATVGGVVASGLSGPARPFRGAVKDFVLGIKCLSGEAHILNFGGRVMKNVAGFDVSRLMVGALGCLGVLLEITLRVVPKPQSEKTIAFEHADANHAIEFINALAAEPLPVSAAAWYQGVTRIRLSGSDLGIVSALQQIGGDVDQQGVNFWNAVRQQSHPFFDLSDDVVLMRGSLAPATAHIATEEQQLIDWAGAQRWVKLVSVAHSFCDQVRHAGGHVTQFRNGARQHEVFDKLPDAVMKIHQNLKQSFDPFGILNVGRMYQQL